MTNYKIIVEINNRLREEIIPAHSSMEAFKKWKERTPKHLYKASSIHDIDIIKEQEVSLNKTVSFCFPCNSLKFLKAC